jgi:hypothetical protein
MHWFIGFIPPILATMSRKFLAGTCPCGIYLKNREIALTR